MDPKSLLALLSMALVLEASAAAGTAAYGGIDSSASGYRVLDPIRHGNLSVFPVVAAKSYDTGDFLTLDEGLRSGEVVVTEYGRIQPLVRRRPPRMGVPDETLPPPRIGPEVNRLVLVNNSKRPLILLAGEIVTGGKQDRVIAKDRIVPAESDPIDLGVFCVEPGRWVGTSNKFDSLSAPMAAPKVRAGAMVDKSQAKVWSEVRNSQSVMVESAVPTASGELGSTTSYAKVMDNEKVKEKVDSVAEPIRRDYESVIKQLRDRNAVGVVVAVNGEIIWADIFASTSLLQKYWPKLIRSYAADAVITRAKGGKVDTSAAQGFLGDLEGRHETVESAPGLYRHTEISGDGFKAFALTSLLPKTGFDLHIAKMAE